MQKSNIQDIQKLNNIIKSLLNIKNVLNKGSLWIY